MNRPEQNFHLVLLNNLLSSNRVSKEQLSTFVRASVDIEALCKSSGDGLAADSKIIATIIERLAAYPISDDDLAAFTSISSDGGDKIYMFIERLVDIDSGGESNWYNTPGSPVLARCTNVESIRADVYFQGVDCRWLSGLPKLKKLNLGRKFTAPEALSTIPALKSVELAISMPDDSKLPDSVAAALLARGVTLFGTSMGTPHRCKTLVEWKALLKQHGPPQGLPSWM